VGLAGSSKNDANVVSINNLRFASGHGACFRIIYAGFKTQFSVALAGHTVVERNAGVTRNKIDCLFGLGRLV
jgi:Multicopper oxidase